MKKSIFYYLFAVVCTVCLFTACSDDDDDNNKSLTVDNIVGTYTGTMNIKTATGTAVGDPVIGQKISLTKVSDSKVKLVLANFSFSGITLGNIEADCTATFDAKDNEYDLVGSTTLDLSAVGLGTLGITISGDADNRELDVDITVSDVPVFNVIKVDFEGTK